MTRVTAQLTVRLTGNADIVVRRLLETHHNVYAVRLTLWDASVTSLHDSQDALLRWEAERRFDPTAQPSLPRTNEGKADAKRSGPATRKGDQGLRSHDQYCMRR